MITELKPAPNTTADARRVRWRGTALVEGGEPGHVVFAVDYGETIQTIATRGICGYVGALRFTCKIVAVEVDGLEAEDLPRRVSGLVKIVVEHPARVERVEFSLSCIEDQVRDGDQWSWLPEEDQGDDQGEERTEMGEIGSRLRVPFAVPGNVEHLTEDDHQRLKESLMQADGTLPKSEEPPLREMLDRIEAGKKGED
jgi:hypothetical protein